MTAEADDFYMAEPYMVVALSRAQAADTMFGAVLVRGGEIVARAHNTIAETGDPSAHAELNLIRAFCVGSGLRSLAGYALYTTAEPCPMCAALCAFTGVSEVVFGVSITDLVDLEVPQLELSCAEVVSRGPAEVAVRGGVLRDACLTHCRTLAGQKG